MRVSYKGNAFVWTGKVEHNHIPKRAGFMFNPITRQWETQIESKAARLREYFDESAKEMIERNSVRFTPWPGALLVPPSQELKSYQEAGVVWALRRNHSYLAFEQGLGKTPTALVIANTVALPTLIVCPPFLVDNWKREMSRWLMNGKPGNVVNGQKIAPNFLSECDVYVLPDTLLDRPKVLEWVRELDIGLLIVDEAQRFKSFDAKRTRRLFDDISRFIPKIVLLSGTPMPNRPMELWPALSRLAHSAIDYRTRIEYGLRYCAGYKDDYGWNFSGESNAEELRDKLHSDFMMRVRKKDVLHDLPPKINRAVLLSGGSKPKVIKVLEDIVLKRRSIADLVGQGGDLGDIATLRKEIARHKFALVVEYVKDILINTDEALIVLGHHKDFLVGLMGEFLKYNPSLMYGDTPMRARQPMIDDFQNGKTRLFIGQINTMVGFNLTRATRVVFGEFSWTPGDNEQASDRAHRIGQTEPVTVDYLALANTLDEYILDKVLEKQGTIDAIVNKEV